MSSEWVLRHELAGRTEPLPQEIGQWASDLTISKELAVLLWRRGLSSRQEMEDYLSPGLRHLSPLGQWPGFVEAARLIAGELAKGRVLAVFGDYDVDGVTATALVKDFMRRHGLPCLHHIPDRMQEGYGVGKAAVERLAQAGAGIMLTVDCGISDHVGIATARELGLTVVISDHHLPADTLPDAHAICNPRMVDCPCPSLAGVGVAFLLMAALNVELQKQSGTKVDMRELLDLVAVGTLADVVDLSGQNRILVKNGLLLVNEGRRPGIAALKAVSGHLPSAALDAGQVVFTLAPRINAAGRVGQAESALQLLLCQERATAETLATELNALNLERREEEERIVEEAKAQAEEQLAKGRLSLVLYASHWHPGIVGIVASRMVELYYRPTIILCTKGKTENDPVNLSEDPADEKEVFKGSGRSVSEFNLHTALNESADLLLGYGGHKQAAGLSLLKDNLEAFRDRFDQLARKQLGETPLRPKIKIDAELDLNQAASFNFLKELEMLQPFGMGNPEPVFSAREVVLRAFKQKGNYLQFDVMDKESGLTMRAKAWRRIEVPHPGGAGTKLQLAFSPRINRYNGVANIELQLKDWQTPESGTA